MSTSPRRWPLGCVFPLVLLLPGAPASADGLSREVRDAEALRIAEAHGESLEYCRFLAGTTRNLCVVEADGTRSVALAELEAAFRPSRSGSLAAFLAAAEAAYSLTTARCEAGPAADRAGCMALGRAELRSARAGADLFYGSDARVRRPVRPSDRSGGKARR